MAKKKVENKAAQEIFEQNPDKAVLFGTTDGNLFEDKYFAKLHADTLEEGKRDVETIKNVAHMDVTEDEEQ